MGGNYLCLRGQLPPTSINTSNFNAQTIKLAMLVHVGSVVLLTLGLVSQSLQHKTRGFVLFRPIGLGVSFRSLYIKLRVLFYFAAFKLNLMFCFVSFFCLSNFGFWISVSEWMAHSGGVYVVPV